MAERSKKREKDVDREKYEKKKRKKKKLKLKRQAQAISRERRNYVRRQTMPHAEAFRKYKNKHLLFVIKDTENMERVLMQKYDLGGNGLTLLGLPVINEEMIEEYLEYIEKTKESTNYELTAEDNMAIKGFVDYFYSIIPGEIIDQPQVNMMIFRDCKPYEEKDNLMPLNVRPYNLNTWYNQEATSVKGYKVFQGKKLKTFFKIDQDLGKTYIFQDTLTELLYYKAIRGKIGFIDFMKDHDELARKGNFFSGLYEVLATNEKELHRRFAREKKEDKELEDR